MQTIVNNKLVSNEQKRIVLPTVKPSEEGSTVLKEKVTTRK